LKTTIKKITSIFFIFLGLAPFLFACLLIIKQQSIRHRMKHRMEDQLLHTVTLADNEIHWVKKGKEIRVGDKLFDIKFTTHTNGHTNFHGLYDEEETNLDKLFQETWKKNQAGQNRLLAQFFQTLQNVYCKPAGETVPSKDPLPEFRSMAPPRLISLYRQILTPPPQA